MSRSYDWPHLASDEAVIVRSEKLAHAHVDMLAALVDAREQAGMTQKDVAEVLGVSQQRVSEIERYDSDPQLSTLRRYASAVGALIDIKVFADDSTSSDFSAESFHRFIQQMPDVIFLPKRHDFADWSETRESSVTHMRTFFALSV